MGRVRRLQLTAALVLFASVAFAADCKSDADCLVTMWHCCGCPEQHAISVTQLKAQEDACAVKKCAAPHCETPSRPAKPDAVAVCTAGRCVIGTPAPSAKAECTTAADCKVEWQWSKDQCCPDTPVAVSKTAKRPAPLSKHPGKCKCAALPEAPALECLESRCQLAPRALAP